MLTETPGVHAGKRRRFVLGVALCLGAAVAGCAGQEEEAFGERVVARAEVVEAEAFEIDEPPEPGVVTTAAPIDGDAPVQFADAGKLAAVRQQWAALGIDSYVYRAVLLTETLGIEEQGEACGDVGGSLTVEVIDGELVRATVTEQSCSIDLESPTRPPLTAEELYDALVEYAAGPAGGVEFAPSNQWFPQVAYAEGADRFLQFELQSFEHEGGSGPEPEYEQIRAQLDDAWDRWVGGGLTSYALEVEQICFCDPGDRISVVEEGVVVGGDFSVQSLFAFVEEAIDGEADGLEVLFNPSNGVPIGLLIDPDFATDDDEVEYQVHAVIPTAGRPDLGELLRDLGSDPDDAPSGAVELGAARFCGLDRRMDFELVSGDVIARRCVVSGFEQGIDSLLVQVYPTIEGDPIVMVTRVDDGEVARHIDTSQDEFGGDRGWGSQTCDGGVLRAESSSLLYEVVLDCPG